MNSGMEDCTVMWELMQKHKEDWKKVFAEYQELRKPDGDGVQDLSLHNYYVMRDYVGDPKFLLQKKIEAHFSAKHPEKWLPLYSQVTFSHIRYSVAWKTGQKQDAIMKNVMAQFDDIENLWDSAQVEKAILSQL
jgi:kynurenine 3-monooxygenase